MSSSLTMIPQGLIPIKKDPNLLTELMGANSPPSMDLNHSTRTNTSTKFVTLVPMIRAVLSNNAQLNLSTKSKETKYQPSSREIEKNFTSRSYKNDKRP